VDIGGQRLHLVRSGTGSPAVVFEAGAAASSLSWTLVQPAVAGFANTCAYDRAGLGWSDAARSARSVDQLIAEDRGQQVCSTPFLRARPGVKGRRRG